MDGTPSVRRAGPQRGEGPVPCGTLPRCRLQVGFIEASTFRAVMADTDERLDGIEPFRAIIW
jgi:hypothetical protein